MYKFPPLGFPGGSVSKESVCDAEDPGSILGSGRSPGGGHGNGLQYSRLEKPHGLVVVMPRGLVAPWRVGFFLDQGWNLCLLHWQADSSPLGHQVNPIRAVLNHIKMHHSNHF